MFSRKELEIINSYIPSSEIKIKNKLNKILVKPLSVEEMFEIAKTITYIEFVERYLISELEKSLFSMINKAGQCEIQPIVEALYYNNDYTKKDIASAIKRLKKQNIIWDINEMENWIGGDLRFKR